MRSVTSRARILLIVASLLTGGAVLATSLFQRHGADVARNRQVDAQLLLTSMLDEETGVRGFLLTGQEEFLEPYLMGRQSYAAAQRRALRAAGSRGSAHDAIVAADRRAQIWETAAARAIEARRRTGRSTTTPEALKRKEAMDAFRTANRVVQDRIEDARDHDSRTASFFSVGGSLLVALIVALFGEFLLIRRGRRERGYRLTQAEFAETMQVVQSEKEAHGLLKRHLERTVPTSVVTVLNRNNSADRLEPTTRIEDPVLAERLEGAEPRTCLAIRLSRTHEREGGTQPLLDCEICGATATSVRCNPLLVGSEVIGSVLVTHVDPLGEEQQARLSDSISTAAPVLANMRNLAIAETRAATDALTGLPNRRAVEDALKRMVAQASRTVQPLGALMLDLDRFKQLNDLHGHERGDEALAAVGALLADCIRTSDFAGRMGGEEFIVLAPNTDINGAQVLAENLRAGIARLQLPGIEQLTASLGVAAYPESAIDGASLMRMADRALYAAKERGRNRVEVAARMRPDGDAVDASGNGAPADPSPADEPVG